MKTLLVLRHAKSDWGNPGLRDFDRPLASRGLADAPHIGKLVKAAEVVPDLIVASPAKRTTETAQLVAESCGYNAEIEWEDSFYEAATSDLLKRVHKLPESVERVLLVGHNPSMEEFVTALCSRGVRLTAWGEPDSSFVLRMPTAALAYLQLPATNWANISFGDAELHWFLIPKLVKKIC